MSKSNQEQEKKSGRMSDISPNEEIKGKQYPIINDNTIHNDPKENDCYFQMNLYAEDKLIWKSGYVSPCNGYYNIELNRTFSTGTLQGFLLIKCYKQDGTELNSAKVKFQITVI